MADDLAQRAARYFGVEDKPRTSISVGQHECLIVLRRSPKDSCLAYYSEEYRTTGHYIWLTNSKLDALREALDALGSAPSREFGASESVSPSTNPPQTSEGTE